MTSMAPVPANESAMARSCGKGPFDTDGFALCDGLLTPDECDALSGDLTELQCQAARKQRAGLRNVLRSSPRAASIARSPKVLAFVSELIGTGAFPVRAIFFNKTPEANWSVPWHQDLAIAVAERIDTPGFGPWSVKEGVVHVQPPCEILADMLALRIHFDDCDASNGALKVIAGSHLQGELDNAAIASWVAYNEAKVCEVARGSALAMRPLLLHASSAANNPAHRRVLHIEYAARELPNGLQWFER